MEMNPNQFKAIENVSLNTGPRMKKSQSLEYKRPNNAREISNIWDLKNAKTLLDDQQHLKTLAKSAKQRSTLAALPSSSRKNHVADPMSTTKRDIVALKENKKALKEVIHRKEQLQSILNHLKGPTIVDASSKSSSSKSKTTSTVKKLKSKKSKKSMKILPPYLPTVDNATSRPPKQREIPSHPSTNTAESTIQQNPTQPSKVK